MVNTRNTLQEVTDFMDESMGVRQSVSTAQFSPVASAKDVGRLPLRTFGQVDIDRIIPDPDQPRVEFDPEELQHLADSIRDQGQLQPIRIRWQPKLEKWIIVAGERRWRATRLAGLPQIDCCFIDGELSPSEILEQQLIENLLRQNLKPMEEARAYSALMELNDWTGKQVAQSLRVSRSKVSRALALLDLPAEIQQQVESGQLPPTSAYELSKLDNEEAQRSLAGQVTVDTLTQKQTIRAVRQRRGQRTSLPRGTKLTFQAVNDLKVVVQGKQKRNYHEVLEALQETMEEIKLRIANNVQLF